MADIFDKKTKTLLKSVSTPRYLKDGNHFETDRFIINPGFVPNCEPKYIIVDNNDVIKEMTPEEKAVVDYVFPAPEPTPEETEQKRKSDIRTEIRKSYPTITDELNIVRVALAELLPENITVQLWNDVVIDAIQKYTEHADNIEVIEEENANIVQRILDAIKDKLGV